MIDAKHTPPSPVAKPSGYEHTYLSIKKQYSNNIPNTLANWDFSMVLYFLPLLELHQIYML